MDRSVLIKLVAEAYTTDSIGQQIATETKTEVFATLDSISSAEFARAGQLGLKPEMRFSVFAPEYSGEKIVEYDGARYAVYRTFRTTREMLELYCERKTGDAT